MKDEKINIEDCKKVFNDIHNITNDLHNSAVNSVSEYDEYFDKTSTYINWLMGIPTTSLIIFITNFDKFIIEDVFFKNNLFISILILNLVVVIFYGYYKLSYQSYLSKIRLHRSRIKSLLNSVLNGEKLVQMSLKNYDNAGIDKLEKMNNVSTDLDIYEKRFVDFNNYLKNSTSVMLKDEQQFSD